MKRTKYRWKPKRKKSALSIWMSSILACRPTLGSARQIRKARHQLRKAQPELHKEMKVAARTKRGLARKLNGARVSWARKLWAGRRKASKGSGTSRRRASQGRSVHERHFPGQVTPSPRRSLKWHRPALRGSQGVPVGSTRTPSHKLGFSEYRRDLHAEHQRRRVDTSPRTGCYAQVREKEKK